MTTVILFVALAAALACPLHMLWHMRRGNGAKAGGGCGGHGNQSVEDLRARQNAIAHELAGREAAERQGVLS